MIKAAVQQAELRNRNSKHPWLVQPVCMIKIKGLFQCLKTLFTFQTLFKQILTQVKNFWNVYTYITLCPSTRVLTN